MSSSAHIALETLVDIVEKRLTSGAMETAMAHVEKCSACSAKVRQLQQVILLMTSDTAEDAPRDVLASAMSIFSAERTSTVRRVVATLVFDSRTARPAFGMRSLNTAWRQLLYTAPHGDIADNAACDVDLRIKVQNQECTITGQVIREDCSGGIVEISGASGSTQANLNALCEFTLPPVPVGKYSLRLTLPDVQIEIPDLELED
ncbi:MAG TPA: hypothetical protein VFB65_01095 [Pyrinomonadaceae bacterium]|nr:hypothetical protein [Pyrinomonadaceae bacterium]